jgi:polysaccharide export outer membrane protein
MNLRISLLLLCGITTFSCCGQASPAAPFIALPTNESELQSLLHAKRAALKFRADDVLTVEVYGIRDYAVEQRVAEDGSILLPFLGKVAVADRTTEDVELQLEERLARAGIVRNPQVTVRAVSQPWVIVTVSGDVAKPGTFPAYGKLTVIDYLSQAGGLNQNVPAGPTTNSPASSVVTLIRPSLSAPATIDLGSEPKNSPYAKIPLFPGDEIRVAKLGVVYAVGAFKSEGAYPLKTSAPTTVLQLVALAGGTGFQADKRDARIVRTRNSAQYVLDIDVGSILKGSAADVPLQADDIVFVPTNAMKAALKGGGSGVIVSLAAAYLYAHP